MEHGIHAQHEQHSESEVKQAKYGAPCAPQPLSREVPVPKLLCRQQFLMMVC
jgi:hypothetical protein